MSVISRVELDKALTLKTKEKKQALNILLLFALSIAEIHSQCTCCWDALRRLSV